MIPSQAYFVPDTTTGATPNAFQAFSPLTIYNLSATIPLSSRNHSLAVNEQTTAGEYFCEALCTVSAVVIQGPITTQ
ncbi:MAG: hypothetical protein DMG93_09675 [Acidobacteria bacterium]|nr:MAG: hypothetical protein DMG93_09675 [Acidobacteriota bacterium]